MSNKKSELIGKDNPIQAIVVTDTFDDEFVPMSNDIPLALLPVVNKPSIDYTLEFLSLGGVEETFLFCCHHVDAIKNYINQSIKNGLSWTMTMKINIIVSESCYSFGDCLRDIDAKGLLRGNFVLIEPGVIANLKLQPLIKRHNEICRNDKGAAMTLIFQEIGLDKKAKSSHESIVVAINNNKRILYHKKLGHEKERKILFPLEIFLENNQVSLHHNLKDTHIAICSPAVLPLYSDNFDFQTKNDFVKGLLMNEEILGSTLYCNVIKGNQSGGAITNWRQYQNISRELKNNWLYPVVPSKTNRFLKNDVTLGNNCNIAKSAKLSKTILGDNVVIGNNVHIQDSFIMSNTIIGDNSTINLSIIGPDCCIKSNCKITFRSILGKSVVLENDKFVEDCHIQSNKPDDCKESDILNEKAYRLRLDDDDTDRIGLLLSKRFSHLHLDDDHLEESDSDNDDFEDSDEEDNLSELSMPPDDTKMFFTEVIDSLTRGFEDELQCDNLILEINSSRYAYNVTVKEVNFNVIKAILSMSLRQPPIGAQYFSLLLRLLSYFSPILKNYIRNESAMIDCLNAIQDVAITNENINEKWVTFVVKYFYEKDYLSEESILKWFDTLDMKNHFYLQIKPFADWLNEAEEASSSDESD